MEERNASKYEIRNTSRADLPTVMRLFNEAIEQNGTGQYRVWADIDRIALQNDIDSRLQYKVVAGGKVRCVFSIQFSDPLIWGQRDRNNAVYLHRIVVDRVFKGQKQFEQILSWAVAFAKQHKLQYIRMDTWADNHRLIAYYRSYGFVVVDSITTPDTEELPAQNRNLTVVLLELEVE